jgi:hypothetical protein
MRSIVEDRQAVRTNLRSRRPQTMDSSPLERDSVDSKADCFIAPIRDPTIAKSAIFNATSS